MALSSPSTSITTTTNHHLPKLSHPHSAISTITFPAKPTTTNSHISLTPISKWRTNVSFFTSFLNKNTKDATSIKEELLDAISKLDRGADATTEDQQAIELVNTYFGTESQNKLCMVPAML
ncbi:probable plastid-lipid-associated protein 4, chloroplastic [Tanacetum coccineum]